MALFLKIIEWVDDSKDTIVYKCPTNGRDINQKSKLIVRESQEAIFVHKGKVCDVFGPGTYNLKTEIFPILSKLAGWAYGFQTPIAVDVYFINTKQFTGIKWGTANPIIMRDSEFGMIRVKGYGAFAFKVTDSATFLRELFGTNSTFVTSDITNWLKTMLLSSLADTLGESKVSVLDLAGNTLEFNESVKKNIQEHFNGLGLTLTNLFIENMSVPEEVEKTIDERSRLGVLEDKTDVMMKVSAAEAMRDAAKNEGMGGAFMGAGVGLGAGAGMGSIFTEAFKSAQQPTQQVGSSERGGADKKCSNCGAAISPTAKFCSECGQKQDVKRFCPECGKEVGGSAKFCPECGTKL